ncbi:MAG: class IV adenylate cyclase [Patescibacteria group bacterium]|nr:class IV adenylate cyclase [Patescibacteria group bacterium]MDE1944987.1 class IV adenylate cyclase [Patescibacteria group bacterium]MDE2057467.1 class IV adenylate cyclase [Patescibacteria group bacterium]
MEEVEIKFLEIDRPALEEKLTGLGAQKIGDYHYRRIVFDHPDFRLDKAAAWIRLRDEGDTVTLAFKQRTGVTEEGANDSGMYEREVIVSDFDATRDILLKAGLVEKTYQENKRTRYLLDGVECDIDSWPLLPDYLELEGQDWEQVYAVADKLGYKREDAKIFSANQVYKLRGLDDRNYVRLTFDEQIERTENRF